MSAEVFRYYHVAPVLARDDIARDGLVFDADVYEDASRAGVYAWAKPGRIMACIREFEKMAEMPFEVWEISSPTPWEMDDATYGGVFSPAPVLPAQLHRLSPQELAALTRKPARRAR